MRSALTVRWSLADVPDGVEQELRDYLAHTSHARFEQRKVLAVVGGPEGFVSVPPHDTAS
jgi:hypothetical protein